MPYTGPRFPRKRDRLRRSVGAFFADGMWQGMSLAGKALPWTQPARHGVERIENVPYTATGHDAHLLDIYRPASGGAERRDRWGKTSGYPGPGLPVALYIHGGAFRILSKDTHFLMGLAFARRGFLVFNINYRLAPENPFPAALDDVATAYQWVVENAARYGGDVSRLVVAGESAGANLAAGVALCAAYERPEPWARRIFATGVAPRAVLPACGIYEVTRPDRFKALRLPRLVQDRFDELTAAYLDRATVEHPEWLDLASPAVILERGEQPVRPLPPFFAPVGSLDPLLPDTRRLKAALDKLGVRCDAPVYPGEFHAFHAMVWRPNARQCWKDHFAFINEFI